MKAKSLQIKNSRNTTLLHLSVMLLLAAAVMYLGQVPASMQSEAPSVTGRINPRQVKSDDAAADTVPGATCEAPTASSNIAYATTLVLGAGNVVTENNLISFNLATPGTIISNIPVQGLNTGTSEYLNAIDFRPATGELYGIISPLVGGTSIRLVRVNLTTGATTQVGAPIPVANPGNFNAMDFNPVPDRIRLTHVQARTVAGNPALRDDNFRINPDTGAVTVDTPLQFAAGDPNAAADEFIAGSAYTNNFPGATTTTLYAIDAALDRLVTQGSVDGTPTSPNTGQLFTVGAITGTNGTVGFDITSDNRAFALLSTSTTGFFVPSGLYSINLATGASTLVGTVGGSPTRAQDGLAIAPQAPVCGLQLESEPNDDFTTADPLTVNRTIGTINPVGDADYYRIDNVAPGSLLFAYTDTGDGPLNNTGGTASRDSQIEIFAADGTTRIEFDDDDGAGNGGDGTSETGFASAVAGTPLTTGGTYYIRVDGFSATTTIINQYNLFVNVVAPAPVTAETEPNDTSLTATALPLGQLATGTLATPTDVDFFRITVPANSRIDLALDGDPERNASTATPNVNHQLALIGTDGTTVLFNANSGINVNAPLNPEAEAFSYVVAAAGTYFVRVITASTTGEGTYRLVANACNFAATAATASVSGRVLSASGKPLSGITMTLSGGTGAARTLRTERNGTFYFGDVEVGQTYLLEARSKRYSFSPQVITVTEDLTGVDFVASP